MSIGLALIVTSFRLILIAYKIVPIGLTLIVMSFQLILIAYKIVPIGLALIVTGFLLKSIAYVIVLIGLALIVTSFLLILIDSLRDPAHWFNIDRLRAFVPVDIDSWSLLKHSS